MNKEKLKKLIEETKNLTDEELKERFIQNFGIQKWEEEEMLGYLIDFENEVVQKLGIDFVPILFDDISEDSRIYLKEQYIVINTKYRKDKIECMKCIVHECRHIYQAFFMTLFDTPKAKRWKAEAKHFVSSENMKDINEYANQELELDAFAFTKWYLKQYHDIDVIHPSDEYEKLINTYIKKVMFFQ